MDGLRPFGRCLLYVHWDIVLILKSKVIKKIKKEKKEQQKRLVKEKKKQKLHNLTVAERNILKYYIKNKTKTQKLWVSKGEVWGLKEAGIIWLAEPHPEEIFTGFCDFNIDDFCWNYLNEYPKLLD